MIVWFKLEEGSPSRLDMPDDAVVDQLRDAVKRKCPNTLKYVDAISLDVFAAEHTNNTPPLDPGDPVPAGTTSATPLAVTVEGRPPIAKKLKRTFAVDSLLPPLDVQPPPPPSDPVPAGTTSATPLTVTGPRMVRSLHELVTIPKFKTFRGPDLVTCNTKYAQRQCSCRSCKCRTYCKCTPGVYLCTQCYAAHVAEGQLVPRTID